MTRFFLLLLFPVLAYSASNQYKLEITDAAHHLANVEATFNNISTKTFEVKLPVWRSGKYKILNLSNAISQFEAFDKNGNQLVWQKQDKNTWKIFLKSPGTVKIQYQIYANNLRNRVSHIDTTHAFLDASGVFIYSESQRDKNLTVELEVPESWRSVSGMEKISKHKFIAENYDVLVDSPIESGIHFYDSVSVEGVQYEIVIWGKSNFDIKRLKDDIVKLHHQAKNIWKTFPFERYVYIYHTGDNLRGATEHLNSTIIHADRFGFAPDKKYQRVIGTTAHEFIHTWNVKSYRPAGISPYDYDKENYSELFWIAEGTTSYYDSLINLRAGIFDKDTFFKIIGKDVYKYQNKPGKEVMSLTQSSFDSWIHASDSHYSKNNTVNIYLKGALVSWLLDKEIRELTDNEKSLDDLHHLLFENYGGDKKGYSGFNVLQQLQSLTGKSFTSFWDKYVDGIEEIDFDDLLNFYGLKIKKAENKDTKIDLGIEINNSNSLAIITVVSRDSAAWKAGLTAGDTLVALDGFQLTHSNVISRIEGLELAKEYSLHYFNQGELKKTKITPEILKSNEIKIVPVDSPSEKQKEIFKSWSHIDLIDEVSDDE